MPLSRAKPGNLASSIIIVSDGRCDLKSRHNNQYKPTISLDIDVAQA